MLYYVKKYIHIFVCFEFYAWQLDGISSSRWLTKDAIPCCLVKIIGYKKINICVL